MKIWFLKALEHYAKWDADFVYAVPDNPWQPWYDKIFSMVIIAPDEQTARQIAQETANENSHDDVHDVWLNSGYTSCEEITQRTEAGLVMFYRRNA